MTRDEVARHELRHVLGTAVGALIVRPQLYNLIELDVVIGEDGGSVVKSTPDLVERGATSDDLNSVMTLSWFSALAPCAKAGRAGVLRLIRGGLDLDECAAAGDLSDADLAHAAGCTASLTLQARCLLGVVELQDRLRPSGVTKLAAVLASASAHGPWRLAALIPETEARRALARATEFLAEQMARPGRDPHAPVMGTPR